MSMPRYDVERFGHSYSVVPTIVSFRSTSTSPAARRRPRRCFTGSLGLPRRSPEFSRTEQAILWLRMCSAQGIVVALTLSVVRRQFQFAFPQLHAERLGQVCFRYSATLSRTTPTRGRGARLSVRTFGSRTAVLLPVNVLRWVSAALTNLRQNNQQPRPGSVNDLRLEP
jgi:hypothetical protein